MASLVTAGLLASPVPAHWHAPPWWLRQALCIHGKEGAWDAIGYVHGVPKYAGGMQFLLSTWRSAGGRARTLDDIAGSSPREQLYRAWIVTQRDHGWSREWGTAAACGLR